MNRRQKLVQQQFLNNEKAVILRLQQVYGVALKDINGNIEALMKRFDPETGDLTQSAIYQIKYQEMLKGQIEGILNQMQIGQYLTVSDYLEGCYEDGFVGSLFDLHGQGVPLAIPLDQEAMVRAVQLDSKISQGLYTRLGEDVDLLKRKITAQVSRSVATGISYEQTAKYLAGYTRIGYNKAIRIARTEGHRIQCSAADDAAHQAKDRGADVLKQWDAILDGLTRESHVAVDGEIRELNEPFSNGLMFPGDPAGGAAEVVNCRCGYLQRARWALGGKFTKMNNFTGQLETFDSPEAYDEFKKGFFSPENKKYMNYVQQMQDKYGTKDFRKVLDRMTDQEYNHYSKLLANNPMYNKKKQDLIQPNYDTALAKKLGVDHYDKMHQLVVDCPNQDAVKVWKYYEADVGVGNAHHRGGAYCQDTNVYLNIDEVAKGNSYRTPYQTAFHEAGHAIDRAARFEVTDNTHWGARHFSSAYKNGLFPQTIKDEVQDWVQTVGADLKKQFKDHAGDVEWFHKNGFIDSWTYGMWQKGAFKTENVIPKYSKALAYSAVEKTVKSSGTMLAWGDLSDILEGATGGKISCGVGHGKSYWSGRTYDGLADGLATEAFAEMIDSTFTSPESLQLIQQYLPKSYGVFLEMLDVLK